MRKIAIYGKGGLGKSTATQNTVAGLAEIHRKTVIDYSLEHPQADEYRTLANKIHNNEMFVVPPLPSNEQEKLRIDFGIANGGIHFLSKYGRRANRPFAPGPFRNRVNPGRQPRPLSPGPTRSRESGRPPFTERLG